MTTTATNKGRELALKLAPMIGTTRAITETCSRLCRATTTYARIQEQRCNGSPFAGNVPEWWWGDAQAKWEAAIDKRDDRQTALLERIVADLPTINGQPIKLYAGGDPRGCTVKLVMPGGQTDDFGGDGICVPGA